jgi:mono/diheme cytochrome c family protein
VAASLAGALLLAEAQLVPAQTLEPPFDLKNPAVIAKGNAFFNKRCAGRCHGIDGQEGFDAPIIAGKDYLNVFFVWSLLSVGRPGTAMPSWLDRLTNEELWEVTAFVASLGDRAR